MNWRNLYISIITLLLTTIYTEWCRAEEYGSYDHSEPAFQFLQTKFRCAQQHQRIEWDMLAIEVHPHNETATDCAVTILRDEHEEIWSPLDKCINDNNTADNQCRETVEYGLVFQFNTTALTKNPDINYRCIPQNKEPEITAIHLIYFCSDHLIHTDEYDDILTVSPKTPPLPPSDGDEGASPIPPPRPSPTMVVHSDVDVTVTPRHNIVTTQKGLPDQKSASGEESQYEGASREHAVTARELAVIVGPSVAALVVVLIIAIAIFVLYKRNQLKLPGDLQGESLFNSRRFSTASQVSDISVNTQPFRVSP